MKSPRRLTALILLSLVILLLQTWACTKKIPAAPSGPALTDTFTSTYTPTRTTSSNTNTPTKTYTPSLTDTPTPLYSSTITFTPTDSPTITLTSTISETPTGTWFTSTPSIPTPTVTWTMTGCSKMEESSSLSTNTASGGTTAVGYDFSAHFYNGFGCQDGPVLLNSLSFSVTTTGNLNTETMEAQLWNNGTMVQSIPYNSSGITFIGSPLGSPQGDYLVQYVFSATASGTLITNYYGYSGTGNFFYTFCGYSCYPATLTVSP